MKQIEDATYRAVKSVNRMAPTDGSIPRIEFQKRDIYKEVREAEKYRNKEQLGNGAAVAAPLLAYGGYKTYQHYKDKNRTPNDQVR